MRDKILPLAIGIILAAVATYMINVYMKQLKEESQEEAKKTVIALQKNQAMVFIARRNIPAGAYIAPNMIDTMTIFRNQMPPNAIRHFGELENKTASRYVKAGELLTTDLVKGSIKPEEATSLSMVVPKGKRATTIPVDNISSLVGMLEPGDHVDVIGIVNLPVPGSDKTQVMSVSLFQNILVLAVGEEYGAEKIAAAQGLVQKFLKPTTTKKDDKKEKNPLITLALDPEDVGIISYVQENGKIRLVLRSPMDTSKKDVPPINNMNFYQFLASRGVTPPVQVKTTTKPTKVSRTTTVTKPESRGIEVYRGLEMEIMEPGEVSDKKKRKR